MTTQSKRLERYRRTKRKVRLALTKRDLDILRIVESYRAITSEHIRKLVAGSNQGILRRLQKLFHAGYLDRIRAGRVQGGGSAKMIYAISNKGFRQLQRQGLIRQATKTDWNAKNRALKESSINHTLLISHIRAVVETAVAGRRDLRLLFWKEGPDTFDAIEVALGEQHRRIPVAPDAFFGIEDPKGRMYFFLEADRGTMTLKRFTLKLKAYAAYWRAKRHEDKFGIRYFRVLTVATSPIRTANLIASAQKAEDVAALGRMFLFTEEQKLSLEKPESLFNNVWTGLSDRERRTILE